MSVGRVVCWIATCVGVLFCVPFFVAAGVILHSWVRSLNPDYYYIPYPYLWVGLLLLVMGAGALAATLQVARRRAYRYVVVPVFLCLYMAVQLPTFLPNGHGPDISHFVSAQLNCDDWWRGHNLYPATEQEIRQAIRSVNEASPYYFHGKSVPYDVVFTANAAGPRVKNITERPGILYYSVSPDFKQYWLTMTGNLDSPGKPTLLVVRGRGVIWVIHGDNGRSPDTLERETGVPIAHSTN